MEVNAAPPKLAASKITAIAMLVARVRLDPRSSPMIIAVGFLLNSSGYLFEYGSKRSEKKYLVGIYDGKK